MVTGAGAAAFPALGGSSGLMTGMKPRELRGNPFIIYYTIFKAVLQWGQKWGLSTLVKPVSSPSPYYGIPDSCL